MDVENLNLPSLVDCLNISVLTKTSQHAKCKLWYMDVFFSYLVSFKLNWFFATLNKKKTVDFSVK